MIYSEAAWERAMARKLTWWQAAEIIGLSLRSIRRWRARWERYRYDGLLGPTPGPAESKASAPGDRRKGSAVVPGALRGFHRAAFSRKAAGGVRHPAELHLGEAGAARGGVGEKGAAMRRAPQAASAPADPGDALAPGRQPAPLVS